MAERTDDIILSIDAGTQSIRAMLVNMRGDIVDAVKTPIEPYVSPQPGWAEQAPEYYWSVLSDTCRRLMSEMRVPREALRGVAVTTQRVTVINVDKDGAPLRPAIVWLDQRKAPQGWPRGALRSALKLTGLLGPADHAVREAEVNWIRANEPEIWEKTHKYLFLSGFFIHRLTGEYAESVGSLVGYAPIDYRRQSWSRPADFKWKMFPMNPNVLPRLVKPGDVIGEITARACEQTGIPAGLPVVAAAADKACEVLGAGCLTPDIACLSFGTTATVNTTTNKYVEVIPLVPPFPAAVPGAYNTEVNIFRGFWLVSWFKREFGHLELELAGERGVAPEQLLDDMIADIPPGCMGLMLQPYWSSGVRVPGPEAKGAIIGFGDVHTRAHVYRAILEGLAYALRAGLERTERKNKVRARAVRVSGGGSQSRVAMQITADVFNRPAERPHTYETSALGAAIVASVGLKLHSNFETAVAAMTRVGRVFEPIPTNRDIYDELYEKVYTRMYARLRCLYRDIRDITGYPAM